jgi:hypothetical protein
MQAFGKALEVGGMCGFVPMLRSGCVDAWVGEIGSYRFSFICFISVMHPVFLIGWCRSRFKEFLPKYVYTSRFYFFWLGSTSHECPHLKSGLFYSYRNESTGLVRAARNVWTLTVNSEMSNTMAPAPTKAKGEIEV